MPRPRKLMKRGRHMPKLDTCEEIDRMLRHMRGGAASPKGSGYQRAMGKAARACRTGHVDMMIHYLIEAGARW